MSNKIDKEIKELNKKGFWLVNDHYPEKDEHVIERNMKLLGKTREEVLYTKVLAWDYDFGYAKRYTVSLRPSKNSYGFWRDIIDLLKVMLLKIIKTPFIDQSKKKDIVDETITKLTVIKDDMEKKELTAQECLLKLAKDNLGRDITPEDNIPDEVACAENVSAMIKKISNNFPIIPHTMNLYKTLDKNKAFEPTLDLEAGNIIISPTGHWRSNGSIRGHVGIILEDGKIASNNSLNGNWDDYYTISSWVSRYRNKGGYPIYVFKMVDKNVKIGTLQLGSNTTMAKFSTEQTAHYVAFFVFLTELFKLNVSESEVEGLIKGILGVGAIVYAFYKRYKRGDITIAGVRKNA